MSSILEALRELESRRPPTAQGVAAPEEQPTAANRGVELLGIVSIGLVLGAVGFLLIVWVSGILSPTASTEEAPVPAAPAATAPAPSAPEPAVTARPAWLENAEPPRAHVEREASATEPTSGAAADRPARQAKAPAAVEVAAIAYSPVPSERSVTLKLDGTTVRLREKQSAQGVEVQLIEPDGVYVRRGANVFMLEPSR